MIDFDAEAEQFFRRYVLTLDSHEEFNRRLPNRPDWQQQIAALSEWAWRLAHAH